MNTHTPTTHTHTHTNHTYTHTDTNEQNKGDTHTPPHTHTHTYTLKVDISPLCILILIHVFLKKPLSVKWDWRMAQHTSGSQLCFRLLKNNYIDNLCVECWLLSCDWLGLWRLTEHCGVWLQVQLGYILQREGGWESVQVSCHSPLLLHRVGHSQLLSTDLLGGCLLSIDWPMVTDVN